MLFVIITIIIIIIAIITTTITDNINIINDDVQIDDNDNMTDNDNRNENYSNDDFIAAFTVTANYNNYILCEWYKFTDFLSFSFVRVFDGFLIENASIIHSDVCMFTRVLVHACTNAHIRTYIIHTHTSCIPYSEVYTCKLTMALYL